MPSNPRLQARANPKLIQKVAGRAKKAGIAEADLIRYAVTEFLENHKTAKELFDACMARKFREVT